MVLGWNHSGLYRYIVATMTAVIKLEMEKIQKTAPPVWLVSYWASQFLMGRKAEPTIKFAVQLRVSPSEVAVETACITDEEKSQLLLFPAEGRKENLL